MYRTHSKNFPVIILLILITFSLLFHGCMPAEENTDIHYLVGEKNTYTDTILSLLPKYTLQDTDVNEYSYLTGHNLITCLDVQAQTAIDTFENISFFPQCLVTVVLAVDRDQTDLPISGWQDLLSARIPVNFQITSQEHRVKSRAILASVAYGMDGTDGTNESAVTYLKQLKSNHTFFTSDPSCPVTVCFDADAVNMIRSGKNIEIVVPREGTLSFAFGLLGQNPVSGLSDKALLSLGFRLTDGQCENPLYPPAKAYETASRVYDFEHFNRITENSTHDIRRRIVSQRYFSSVDIRENILMMTFTILLVLLWTAAAFHRSAHKDMRKWIWLISGLIVGWLLVSLFKYMLPSLSLLSRLCWYAYYIFLMGLPLTLLYISIVVDQLPQRHKIPKWFPLFGILYIIFLIMIFTNDWHQLVFSFDLHGNWSDDYGYNIVYYLIFAYTIICFVLAVSILIQKSRKSPKHLGWLPPVFIALLLITFNIGYIAGIPVLRQCNLTLIFCIFSVCFMEAVINAGLVPSNKKYKELFSHSPLNIQLLDRSGQVILSSNNARPLTPAQIISIQSAPGTCITKNENTLLHSHTIHGGITVWQEDITGLKKLQKELRTSIYNMRKANQLLQNENNIQKEKIRSQVKEELLRQLENDINDNTRELSLLIQKLPQSKDRKTQITYIPLLLCHIKRRCNLFFLAQEGDDMSSNELALYIDELSEFASYAQIHALVRCGISGNIPVNVVTLCYDFYFYLLQWVIQDSHATLIGQIEQKENTLSFGILSSENTGTLIFSDSFKKSLDTANASVSYRNIDESEGIYLTFSLKEVL